ncbi:MAG: site-specific DNA-methyltransferase [Candidatus Korobacteraceae bacterium]
MEEVTSGAVGLNGLAKAVRGAFEEFLPAELTHIDDLQTAIPRIARDEDLVAAIARSIRKIPTKHKVSLGDAREMNLPNDSVQLILTSPPYWTLKEYRDTTGQMGHISPYDDFIQQLERVWQKCYRSLVAGGRLICVVGDVCLSRRKNDGRHTVVPLHASIQESCRKIGFDNLAPIIWHKIANAAHEVENGGGGFLGKPYEPNAVVKNDIEFILMERKSGGYRTPEPATRILSLIGAEDHKLWFQQIWTGITGASTRSHPAPYPLALADRLIRMFSFVGDTVLDPFLGTGTTAVAAALAGRNSIGIEIDPHYLHGAIGRIRQETTSLFHQVKIEVDEGQENGV